MRNHDILFDKEKGIVGFVRSNCSAVSHLTIPDIIPGTVNSSGYTNENVPVYWPPSKKADDKCNKLINLTS